MVLCFIPESKSISVFETLTIMVAFTALVLQIIDQKNNHLKPL